MVTGSSGAIGSAAIQLCKLRGAFVIGAAGSALRAALAADMGADVTVDYGTTPRFSDRVRELAPTGITAYVEPASDPLIWREALATLSQRARVVVCGAHAGPVVELDNSWLFRSRVAIFGSSASTARGMRHILDLAQEGRIRPNIDSIVPLDQIHEAYDRLMSRRNRGKIVLRVAAD